MNAEQKRFLEARYSVKEWPTPRKRGQRVRLSLDCKRLQLRGWTIQREKRDDQATPRSVHLLYWRGESTDELLALDVFECESVKAAHDQLLEILANVESGIVERKTGKGTPGDVAFGLDETMVLFARFNVVVMARNAGPKAVPVLAVARETDAHLMQQVKSESSR